MCFLSAGPPHAPTGHISRCSGHNSGWDGATLRCTISRIIVVGIGRDWNETNSENLFILVFAGDFLMHFSAHPGIVRELARPCKCECPRLIQELHGLNAAQQLVRKKLSISLPGANWWGMIDPNNYIGLIYLREIRSANPQLGTCHQNPFFKCE